MASPTTGSGHWCSMAGPGQVTRASAWPRKVSATSGHTARSRACRTGCHCSPTCPHAPTAQTRRGPRSTRRSPPGMPTTTCGGCPRWCGCGPPTTTMNRPRSRVLDCPAFLDDDGAARCGLPAEDRCSYTMQSTDGPLDSVMIKCPSGHLFNGPLEFLTWKTGDGQDMGRSFDRGPGSVAMEPASTYTIMAEPGPDGSAAGLGE